MSVFPWNMLHEPVAIWVFVCASSADVLHVEAHRTFCVFSEKPQAPML